MKYSILFVIAFLVCWACSDQEYIYPSSEQEQMVNTSSRTQGTSIIHNLTFMDNGLATSISYDAIADTLMGATIPLNSISTLTIIDTDNDGDGDEGIREFPGDRESSVPNETGGKNVVCIKSDSHCFTSRFTIPEGNQSYYNGAY